MSEGGRGPATGRGRLTRVLLPGPEGLTLERRPRGGFGWTARQGEVAEEVVAERARSRAHECLEAIELCDYWLGQGPEARTPEERDEILDSRFRYTLEHRLLRDFLQWSGVGDED